jgi:uncharacterized protein (TIGR03086 family)
MDALTAYGEALDRNQDRVAAVTDDQLNSSTPCTDWDVDTLIRHITGGYQMFAAAMGHPAPAAAGSRAEAHRAAAQAVRQAFAEPGAMQQTVNLPIGQLDGQTAISVALTDAVVHGWDLAKAIGTDTAIDDRLAEMLLDHLQGTVGPEMRPGGSIAAYGDQVRIDAGRPAGERLVTFLGREP